MSSIWKDICDTYFDETEKVYYVTAWESDFENEIGKTIAKISDNGFIVEYLDPRAETDPYAQEVIHQIIRTLKTDEEEQEPEREILHISVNFHLLMEEDEEPEEAMQRFFENVLNPLADLAETHIDWELAEEYVE